MRGAIPPLTKYVCMAWYLVKQRDNFDLTLYVDETVRSVVLTGNTVMAITDFRCLT